MAKSTFCMPATQNRRSCLIALTCLFSVMTLSASGSLLPAEELLSETVRGGEAELLIRNFKLGQDRQVKPPPTPWV